MSTVAIILPIGSGVTEAACKTVFTQRLKQSGMTWSLEGGQRIVDLRVIQLSGLWPQVYQAYLQAKILPETGDSRGVSKETAQKSCLILGTGAITPVRDVSEPGEKTAAPFIQSKAFLPR